MKFPKPGKKKKKPKDTPETIAHKNWVASQPCMIPGCTMHQITMAKSKTKAEKEHLNWIASNCCSVCDNSAVQVHHIRILGEPRNHFKTIPLCFDHHLGPNGIHHLGKKEFRKRFDHELDMLDELMKRKMG